MYRLFNIEYDPKPIPDRRFDWSAVHRDYDGPGDNRLFYGPTEASVMDQVDEWHTENTYGGDEATAHQIRTLRQFCDWLYPDRNATTRTTEGE